MLMYVNVECHWMSLRMKWTMWTVQLLQLVQLTAWVPDWPPLRHFASHSAKCWEPVQVAFHLDTGPQSWGFHKVPIGCPNILSYLVIWVCLKIVYPYTQWLVIIIPTKWLFHWGYTPFSDIPISCHVEPYWATPKVSPHQQTDYRLGYSSIQQQNSILHVCAEGRNLGSGPCLPISGPILGVLDSTEMGQAFGPYYNFDTRRSLQFPGCLQVVSWCFM